MCFQIPNSNLSRYVTAEPGWVEEGCRRGRVAPIGNEEGVGAVLFKFPRFQVAFAELCYRAEAHEAGGGD